jgi:hypothetical protein
LIPCTFEFGVEFRVELEFRVEVVLLLLMVLENESTCPMRIGEGFVLGGVRRVVLGKENEDLIVDALGESPAVVLLLVVVVVLGMVPVAVERGEES